MIIDLRKPYQWDELNESVKSKLGLEGSVKIFQSMSQAIFEIVMSIQAIYSHKKQFYHSLGLGTHADEGVLFLARQGIKGLEFSHDQVPQIEDKKTLFFLSDIDDAITGQIYHDPETSGLDAKIYRLWISHRKHFSQSLKSSLGENDIVIYGDVTGPVVAHMGRRAQSLQMLLAPTLRWESFSNFSLFPKIKEQKDWVQKIENEKWALGEKVLPSGVSRLYDRALLFWKDLDASALRDLLIKKQNVNPQHLEVVSLSRWNEAKLITQFEKRGLGVDVFRGLLLMSAELSQDSLFKTKLESAKKELETLSKF